MNEFWTQQETVKLERLCVAWMNDFPGGKTFATQPEVLRLAVKNWMGKAVASLDSYVLAEKLSEEKLSARYPKDWWEAFKERWFPPHLLRRWPVRYKKVWGEKVRYATLPLCRFLPKEWGPHEIVLRDVVKGGEDDEP